MIHLPTSINLTQHDFKKCSKLLEAITDLLEDDQKQGFEIL